MLVRTLGLLLVLLGMAIAASGIYGAMSALAQTYQHALEDPLGESEVDEKTDLPRIMLINAAIGATGVIPGVPGLVMLRVGRVRRKREAMARAAERRRAQG